MNSPLPPLSPTADVARLVADVLDTTLAYNPANATDLGDHRFDGQLADLSLAASEARSRQISGHMKRLAATTPRSEDERVDLEILSTALHAEQYELDHTCDLSWNPMMHNPGPALHDVALRDFAPAAERFIAVASRLDAVPRFLEIARQRLDRMSRIHLETAIAQLRGTAATIDHIVRISPDDQSTARIAAPAERAQSAIDKHCAWLTARLDHADHDPRLGQEAFSTKLALTADTHIAPEKLLARAEEELDRVTAQVVEHAARMVGALDSDYETVLTALDSLAAAAPTRADLVRHCADALSSAEEFVRSGDFVTVPDSRVSVIEMPAMDRGVAVAYCRTPGPLETTPIDTEIAVSPAPDAWSPEQTASYYREYNIHMLHNLMVHEAMPGHAVQLLHANQAALSTPTRAVWYSGTFIEGWAVYAEQLMADHGFRSEESAHDAAALRMQQLKMRLRHIINTILDIRYHCGDLDQSAAVDLMVRRGFQEPGEALGKWQRVQLTATQLSTFYLGYCEVQDLIADLGRVRPHWTERQMHDAVLAHGSPPPRYLDALILEKPAHSDT